MVSPYEKNAAEWVAEKQASMTKKGELYGLEAPEIGCLKKQN